MTTMLKLQTAISILLVGFVFALCAQVAAAADASNDALVEIREVISDREYDRALIMLRDLGDTPDCDRRCRGESHILAAYCRYMLGQEHAAYDELERALKFIPEFSADSAAYPARFLELVENARQRVLCSVEIRVNTPESMGLLSDGDLNVVFRKKNVPVGPIVMLESEYGQTQRFRLSPGKLNVFELNMEQLHDYWSYDSLHVSFRPLSGISGRSPVKTNYPGKPRIGRYSCDLLASNYLDTALTRILIGDSSYLTAVGVVETKPEWKKLHHDLATNRSRRKLNTIVRYTSIVGAVVSSVWAWRSDVEAGDKYEEYMSAVNANLISDTYRRYEDLIQKRNILGTFAVTLSAVAIGTFLFAPGSERDLIDEYERDHGASGVYLGVGNDGVEVQLRVGV